MSSPVRSADRGLAHWLRHLGVARWQMHARFDQGSMDRIGAAVVEAERGHAGEIRFAVEASLPLRALLAGKDARTRAIELFSQLRLWDTEGNTGVLLYLLWADRAIEIVVDRGIAARLPADAWTATCNDLRDRLRRGDLPGDAVSACIVSIGESLRRVLPADDSTPDELPDAPVML